MRILRAAMGVTAVATTLSVGVASAATLGTASDRRIGLGSASIQRCDTDGVAAAFTYSGNNVATVTVSGIHDNCSGADLSFSLVSASGAQVGAGTGTVVVPAGGGTVGPLAVASPPASNTVSTVQVLMVGGKP